MTTCERCGREVRRNPTVIAGQTFGSTCIRKALGITPKRRLGRARQPDLFAAADPDETTTLEKTP